MIVKTEGLADVLRSALSPLGAKIRFAIVYGSFARGQAKKSSDVDLLVIGDVGFSEIVEALGSAQGILGREINPVVLSMDEFRRRVDADDHFLQSVLKSDLIFLMGERHELDRLAEKRPAP